MPQEGLIIMERNPYYWKVDVEGNQLPYLDNLRFDYITTGDAAKLKLAQNELDSLGMHDVTMAEYAFYKENEAGGQFPGDGLRFRHVRPRGALPAACHT